ncbi:MAG: hypothetical protein IPP13_27380 [Kouleothrix sp.]|jgi:hypothetical protein|nr:hypothetical protein [Kouleothrix sp.]
MDTEEMYRRGIADAAHGEPHPFYYEHYYQYRRGYDRARRSRGLPGGAYALRQRRLVRLAVVGALLLFGLMGYLVWRARSQQLAATQLPGPSTAPQPTIGAPTHTPIFATPTPVPAPTAVALQVGGTAQVAGTEGSVLRGRQQPKLDAPTTVTFKEGEQVTILAGPVEADGFTWWRIEGQRGAGWSAQQSKEGVVWLRAGT